MKDKRVLGLDLGSGAFKLAVLEEGDKPFLAELKVQELPAQAGPEARRAALRKLLEGMAPLTRFAAVVSIMDDPFACLQPVSVPLMTPGELAGAVKWELQRYLAVSPEEAIVDYQLLEETQEAGVKKLKLLAAALPAGAVRDQLAFLGQAGIRPTRLLPTAVAVAAWWARTGGAQAKDPKALLTIGQKSAEFLVVREGKLLFARKIPVAGSDVTRGMTSVLMTAQGQMGLTEPEAERIKREVGIPTAETTQGMTKGISGVQLLSLIRGSLERLAVEVERSLTFYGELVAGPAVSELILVGGGAHLKGLPAWLQERLKIQVSVPDPLAGIQAAGISEQVVSAGALSGVPALGAALGSEGGINLLPTEVKEAARLQMKRSLVAGTVTAVLLGTVLFWIGIGISRQILQAQIAAFRTEQVAIQPEQVLAKAALAVQEKQREEPQWAELFRQLSLAVPQEVYLVGLNIQERQGTLRGRVRESGRAADQVLTQFLRSLEGGIFTEAQLVSTRQIEGVSNESEFEIRCRLK